MDRFSATLRDAQLRNVLHVGIRGPSAFRFFKRLLTEYNLWTRGSSLDRSNFGVRWCEEHGVTFSRSAALNLDTFLVTCFSPRANSRSANLNFDRVFGKAPRRRDFRRVLMVSLQFSPPRTLPFPLIPATPPRQLFPNSSAHETNDLPFQ